MTASAEGLTALEERLARSSLASVVRRDHPLAPHTTYRVGGPARIFLPVASRAELDLLAACLAGSVVPVLVVGRGSNLLVADTGFDGLALTLTGELAGFGVTGATVRTGGRCGIAGGGPQNRGRGFERVRMGRGGARIGGRGRAYERRRPRL